MEQSDLDLLQTIPTYHLQFLAKNRRLPLATKGQNADTAAALSPASLAAPAAIEVAQQLFQATTISESIRSLNDGERLILRELVACGGRANSRDLALYLTSSTTLYPVKGSESSAIIEQSTMLYPTAHPHGVFEQALRRVLMLGLVFWGKQTNFAGRDYTSGVYDGVLIVPQAVKDVVNEIARQEQTAAALPSVLSEVAIGDGMRQFQRTLYLYWSHVATLREGLAIVQSGLLARAALRSVVELLGPKGQVEQVRTEQDIPRLLFIRLILMKLGLLQERQGAFFVASAHDFFALPLLERVRRCYHLWLETSFWNELFYLPEVIVRPGPGPLDPAHDEVIRARQALMEQVLLEHVEEWREVPAFIARTKLYIPYLLFPRQYGLRAERYSMGSNPYGWDFRLRRGWLTHREGWHMVEGGFIRAVVLGPLHWLGLVEVNSESFPSAFRPAPGIELVTSEEPPEVEAIPWGRLIVQPNFEMVALAPVSEALLIQLDRFAERVGLEHIAQYRITKASITRAIQTGLHAETIMQVLTEAADGGEIPQNVHYSLIEWERQARRIEMWQSATLLEVDDAALLDALFADEGTRALFVRRVSPVLAEVMPQQLHAMQEMLWQRDYLSALTAAPLQDTVLEDGRLVPRESQWRLREDGLLQPIYAVTDLYLAAEVARISILDEVTGWRKITPNSIERANEDGLSLNAMLTFLQRYCEGGIPPSFLMRLKLWGDGYGEQDTITVEQAPMLYLSEQVLHDLQSDAALQSLLGSPVAQEGRLVRVPAAHLAEVLELLRERGFEVE